MELETEVLITVQEGYCSEAQTLGFWAQAPEVGRLLNGLARALGTPAKRSARPGP